MTQTSTLPAIAAFRIGAIDAFSLEYVPAGTTVELVRDTARTVAAEIASALQIDIQVTQGSRDYIAADLLNANGEALDEEDPQAEAVLDAFGGDFRPAEVHSVVHMLVKARLTGVDAVGYYGDSALARFAQLAVQAHAYRLAWAQG